MAHVKAVATDVRLRSPQPMLTANEPNRLGNDRVSRRTLLTWRRLEVVTAEPQRHIVADLGALYVGGAEVDAAPDASINDLLYGCGESLEVPWLAREATGVHVEGDLVRAEELLRRIERRR